MRFRFPGGINPVVGDIPAIRLPAISHYEYHTFQSVYHVSYVGSSYHSHPGNRVLVVQ